MDGAGLTPSGAELEPHENHFLGFKHPLAWIQLELYFLHT